MLGMALRVKVCRADQVGPGELKGFKVEGVSVPIMVANVDGDLLAATSMCPHDDVSLLRGRHQGSRVMCPGHGYQFDMRSGSCSHDPNLRLQRYRVSVVDGDVYVDLVGAG